MQKEQRQRLAVQQEVVSLRQHLASMEKELRTAQV